jgi:hypothetical protein
MYQKIVVSNSTQEEEAVSNSTQKKEVIFKYIIPELDEGVTFVATVYQEDCETLATLSSDVIIPIATVGDDLTVQLEINEDFIASSGYFFPKENSTYAGTLVLCLRVEVIAPSSRRLQSDNQTARVIVSHETIVEVEIDLEEGLDLVTISNVEIPDAIKVTTDTLYNVLAYHCDDTNSRLNPDLQLWLDDFLQFCVEVDSLYEGETVHVMDVFSARFEQPYEDIIRSNKSLTIVSESVPKNTTQKTCAGGICNVKSQLGSKWFSDDTRQQINTIGVAVLAFASVADGTRQRFLRVPIAFPPANGSENHRRLQKSAEFSSFGLLTPLASEPSVPPGPVTDSDATTGAGELGLFVIVSAVVLCGCCTIFGWRRRRHRKAEEKSEMGSANTNALSLDSFDSCRKTDPSHQALCFDGNNVSVGNCIAPTRSFVVLLKEATPTKPFPRPSFEGAETRTFVAPLNEGPSRKSSRSQLLDGTYDAPTVSSTKSLRRPPSWVLITPPGFLQPRYEHSSLL